MSALIKEFPQNFDLWIFSIRMHGRILYICCMYTKNVYNIIMIRSFLDKETEKVFNQQFSKKLPTSIQKVALRKLIMINVAQCLSDLKVPPANRLEPLSGNRLGQWSIRINDQYRIVFIPSNDGTIYDNVGIIDYH